MKPLSSLILLSVLSFSLILLPAQNDNSISSNNHFCGNEVMQTRLFEKNPSIQTKHENLENQLVQILKNNAPLKSGTDYILPIVVHVIHNNGAENLADDIVLQGVQDLNDAFANVGYYDPMTGVDTKIQFCLAKQDPDGNATTGINHVQSSLTEMTMETQDIALKDLIRWDPLHYINIWLVKEICSNSIGCGVAGYAYFPSSHGNPEDGIMMEASYFGSSQGNSGGHIHEMGHYLGLYHTFQGGCPNNDCLVDGDRVCDTPPDQSTAAVPCGNNVNSCSTDTDSGFTTDQNDMYWAYMDYGDWDCYSAFTQGQTDRMTFFIDGARESLLDSKACLDPCTSDLTASFFPDLLTVGIGGTVNFFNTSTNAFNYQWQIDNVPFATTTNAAYTFNTIGTFEITLVANNSDPNCEESITLPIEVICPVEISFTTSNLFPQPGENIIFNNTSINANSYEWTVNGIPEATTPSLTYSFDEPGVNWVCLSGTNGLCEEEFCQSLFVFEAEGSGECEGSYFKIFGKANQNEWNSAIASAGDGNFFLGGNKQDSSLLMMVNESGDLIWERTFNFTLGNDFIRRIIIDSDGMLVACGRDQINTNTVNFIFKYDWQNDVVLWSRNFLNPAYSNFEKIVEKAPNENYLIAGMVNVNNNCDAFLMEISRNTGASLWQKEYELGSCEIYYDAEVHDNFIYTGGINRGPGGIDKIRAALGKFDLNGNQVWNRLYYNSLNDIGRTYLIDLLIENNESYLFSRGSLTSSSLAQSKIQLSKTDLDGALVWSKEYDFTGSTSVSASKIASIPDGFILQGWHSSNGQSDIYFMRVDKDGNPIWGKKIDTGAEDAGQRFVIENGFIYFTGYTTSFDVGGNRDITFMRMSLDGEISGDDCDLLTDLEINTNEIVNPYNGLHPNTTDVPNYLLSSTLISSNETQLDTEEIPGCECEEFSGNCESAFVKTFGTPNADDSGRFFITEPNGGFLMGSNLGDSTAISLLNAEAEAIWTRRFRFTNHPVEAIQHMILDSDNNLVVVGFTSIQGGSRVIFAFKYDYQNDNLIWQKSISGSLGTSAILSTVLEKNPGGNYFLLGTSSNNSNPGLGCDALLIEVNRNTGNSIIIKNYNLGSCESFQKAIIEGNTIIATGRHNFAGGGTNKMRPAITQLDFSGNEIWSRLYLVPVNPNNARLYPNDLLVENNSIFAISRGDLSGSSADDVSVQFFSTTLSGNILWGKDYDIVGASAERTRRLVSIPDGFLIMGDCTIGGSKKIFLFKTNKDGDLIWTRSYGNIGNETGADLFFHNGIFYLLGSSNSFGSGDDEIFLAKLDVLLETAADCEIINPLSVQEIDFTNPYDALHPLVVYDAPTSLINMSATSNASILNENIICEIPCADTCATGADINMVSDAVLTNIFGECAGDSSLVTLTVCNEDFIPLPAGNPITFYLEDPTNIFAPIAGSTSLPQQIFMDSCLTFQIKIPLPQNQEIFVIANDNGTTAMPFDLQDDFPNTNIEECDFTNNINSFTIDFTPPVLDLGPDTVMCDNGIVSFDAGEGFLSYEWQDGSTEQTYTTWNPGTFWVTAIDSCGGVHTDNVEVIIMPPSVLDIGTDSISICAGDTITLTVFGFDEYKWTPAEYIDCDTCSTISLSPDTSMCYILVGNTNLGCYSIDTLKIGILEAIETFDTLAFCLGDTISIFGNEITEAGDYAQTFSSLEGCDSTHFIALLEVTDTIELFDEANICQGDSVEFYGNYFLDAGDYLNVDSSSSCIILETLTVNILDTAITTETRTICQGETSDIFGTQIGDDGIYQMTFPNFNGCDSTHLIDLEVLDTFMTTETMVVCQNETAIIFGNPIPNPSAGVYPMTFTAENNCDSTHYITLMVLDTFATSSESTICFGDSISLFGTFQNQTGVYEETFAAFNGCDSVHAVSLTVLPELEVNFTTIPACEGEENGSATATVSGGLAPYSFVWNVVGQNQGTLTNVEPGDYILNITDANNCILEAPVTIETANEIEVEFQIQDISCFGETDGAIFLESANPNLQFSLDGINFSPALSFENLPAGNYNLFSLDENDCKLMLDFFIIEPIELLLQLPNDTTLRLGDSILIKSQLNTLNSVNYEWFPTNGLSCTDCPNPIAQPTETTLYELTTIDSNGCIAIDEMLIIINASRRVYIPNAFSPNGDGFNDFFTIFAGSDVVQIRAFKVFDRWGELVFENLLFQANDPQIGWDGMFRGKPMDPAVFVYFAEIEFLDGRTEIFKGDFLLIK